MKTKRNEKFSQIGTVKPPSQRKNDRQVSTFHSYECRMGKSYQKCGAASRILSSPAIKSKSLPISHRGGICNNMAWTHDFGSHLTESSKWEICNNKMFGRLQIVVV
jgi:hypothetical protein